MKTFYALLFFLALQFALAPHAVYSIAPPSPENTIETPAISNVQPPEQPITPPDTSTPVISSQSQLEAYPEGYQFTHAQIDALTASSTNAGILRKLISCESQNTNVARMDSNGLMSYGILQFNGTSTWATFAPLAGIGTSMSPMNPIAAISVADYMISHGQLHRWTCSRILGLTT